jgi:hypothetical protein
MLFEVLTNESRLYHYDCIEQVMSFMKERILKTRKSFKIGSPSAREDPGHIDASRRLSAQFLMKHDAGESKWANEVAASGNCAFLYICYRFTSNGSHDHQIVLSSQT